MWRIVSYQTYTRARACGRAKYGRNARKRHIRPDGTGEPKALHDDTAAAISSVKVVNRKDGEGEVVEIKLWEKNAALEKLGRHLGLFAERRNDTDLPPVRRITDLTESELIERLLERRARRAKWVEAKSEDERKSR